MQASVAALRFSRSGFERATASQSRRLQASSRQAGLSFAIVLL